MILQKLYIYEKFGSSVIVQNVLNHHIAVFFNHQYLWKESINTLDFLHGAGHQAKVASGKKYTASL